MTDKDIEYMKMALELAKKGRGRTNPNPMVGAVIVKEGRIIGQGYHERCGEGHAEVNAFASCTEDPAGADMYVTLEPCSHYGKTPPCADLVIKKKIKKVYIGSLDPNPLVAGRGVRKLEEAGIEVESGILDDEVRKLNEIFMHYIKDKNPFVLLKFAMSLDGKIATGTGQSQWISCEKSREQVHLLRNQYMAIMVGIGTVLADDPSLTCRMDGGRNPIRIIADSHLKIPLDAKVLKDQAEAKTIIVTADGNEERKAALEQMGIEVLRCKGTDGEVDINVLMSILGKRGIDSVLVEGGGILNDAVLRSGEADKVMCFVAPMLIGGKDAKGPVLGRGFAALNDALRLDDFAAEMIGSDICISGRVRKCLQE